MHPRQAARLFSILTLLCVASGSPPLAESAPVQVTLQIQDRDDDYKETSGGSSIRGDRTHDLWNDADTKQAFRFTNFPVPHRSLIVSATLQVYATDDLSGALDGTAAGEASGDAPAYTGNDDEITDAPKTFARVPVTNLPTWIDDAHNDVADVTPIVQELVNRVDYKQGNAIKIFLLSTSTSSSRRTKTYDDKDVRAAKLVLTYDPDSLSSAACPALLELTTSGAQSAIDIGWTGVGHNVAAFADGSKLTAELECSNDSTPCGQCEISGPVRNLESTDLRNQRCTNNSATQCTRDEDCSAQCLGGTADGDACTAASDCPGGSCPPAGECRFFFGSLLSLPLSGETCVTTRVRGPLTGSVDPASGEMTDVTIPLTNLTPTDQTPCPSCNADLTPNDGQRDGTCVGGKRDGLSCDENARLHPTLTVTSLDCPPDEPGSPAATDIFEASTSNRTIPLTIDSPTCRAANTSALCHCDTCDNAAATPCQTNAECLAVGGTTCGGPRCSPASPNPGAPCPVVGPNDVECGLGGSCLSAPGEPTKPNFCNGPCVNGECTTGPAVLRCVPSAPFVDCGQNADCAQFESCSGGSNAGAICSAASDCPGGSCVADTCELQTRQCYNDGVLGQTVTAAGSTETPTDGEWDAVLPTAGCLPQTTSAFINAFLGLPGLTRLELPLSVRALPAPPFDVAFAGGDDDESELCVGDGFGIFDCSNLATAPSPDAFADVALGDLNADGIRDAAFATVGLGTRICLGNPNGGFDCEDALDPLLHSDRAIAIGDMDDDGVPDIVVNGTSDDRVCQNYELLGLPPVLGYRFVCGGGGLSNAEEMALSDLDDDGSLEVVLARINGKNEVCDSGCTEVSSRTDDSYDVSVADLDGDSVLDLVFANDNAKNRACLADGLGGFTCSDVSTDANSTRGVALGDFDEDGNVDAVFANAANEENRICFGDGLGGFGSCADVSTDAFTSTDVAVADFNRDGNLDALFVNSKVSESQKNRICVGDGSGGFTCQDVSGSVTAHERLDIAN